MPDERHAFLDQLFARCSAFSHTDFTLTAIHPDGNHPTPSRHIRLNDRTALQDALVRLDAANAMGWGAYFAVGLRRPGLTRWKRGGVADVVALPALFVDVDDPSPEALARLQGAQLSPSCIIFSGGGYHAYWWLDEPTTDLERARRLLRGLATILHGDSLSVAQSLRVPSSQNTKSTRNNARCSVIDLNERRYALDDFALFLPVSSSLNRAERPRSSTSLSRSIPTAEMMAQVADALIRRGCKRRGDWLNGACPFPEQHKHGDRHASFGFNIKTGYGFCHVCGTLRVTDLSSTLGIDLAAYSGTFKLEV